MNRNAIPYRCVVALALTTFGAPAGAADPPAPPRSIRVVLDDNYPPYIFRNAEGEVQGILQDLWNLWQQRTGIAVDFQPMDWGKARATMESGQADVIDTIFATEARRRIYDFSPAYATIEVPIFFHQSISGITNATSLKGFTVGVKEGDVCIDHLQAHGIHELRRYSSYEAQIRAAIRQEIRVLCIDKPPASYFFNREGAADAFRHSPPLYIGEFHWAVAKDRPDLKKIIADGFALISDEERAAIETRWLGEKLTAGRWAGVTRYFYHFLFGASLLMAALVAWNWTLRRRVSARTSDLSQSLRELRQSELTFRKLFEDSSDAILLIDGSGVFVECNQAALDLLKMSREQFLFSSPARISPEFQPDGRRSAESAPEMVALAYRQGLHRFDWTCVDAQGGEFIVEVSLMPVTIKGELMLHTTWRDITARKQTEANIEKLHVDLEQRIAERTADLEKANQALTHAKMDAETANRAKSVFLSNMSHELRTPLNAILGFANLLERDIGMSDESREKLATINRAGKHLLALINDVLEISRIEANRMVIDRNPFDLFDLLESVQEMVQVRIQDKGLAFLLEQATPLPPMVEGDAHRLKQVLLNLLGNAVKYTDKGDIRLRVSRGNSDQVCFQVLDTGPGIRAEEQPQLFHAFYQTREGIAKGEGTGLGLTISAEYTRLMGGQLEVHSAPGQGSVFTLTLPLPACISTSVVQKSQTCMVTRLLPEHEGVKVLVVDDKPDNLDLVLQLLTNVGFAVRTAHNGQQAIEIFTQWQPRFIWMDIRMPVMDGYEATRQIRQLPGGDQVRIAALTAGVFEENRREILLAGCDDMVKKPLEEEQLFALMGKLLGVRYLYGRDKARAAPAGNLDLHVLPPQTIAELLAAAEMLDSDMVANIIQQLRTPHPALATELRSLAKNFRFDRIADFCRSAQAAPRQ